MLLARAGTIFSSTATANVFYGSVDFLIFFEIRLRKSHVILQSIVLLEFHVDGFDGI